MRGIIWFREDLRSYDNTALYHAAKSCDEGIVGVYLLDPGMWQHHEVAACRVDFILRGLAELRKDLSNLNIPLQVIEIQQTSETAQALLKVMQDTKAQACFFNQQYEINERKRDAAVTALLKQHNFTVTSYHDQVILPPGSVKTQQGTDYSVFTPYKRAWIKIFLENNITMLPQPNKQAGTFTLKSASIPTALPLFNNTIPASLWPAGQGAAIKRLNAFLENDLFDYKDQRDYPARDKTSKLSPYLASGMISPRQCFLAAMQANHNEIDTGNPGAVTWLSELIWREFYKHLLIAAPRVSMHKAYQVETDKIQWQYNEKQFLAWQQGQTGYPLIDAAMRQLNTLGWMHNRLRMVVAMFLTKNLFFDWRLGEKYFITHLIDGDLASNNGGWQWSASTGTDAAPYFRIFNPIRQSERFDPEGEFIKKYCPELKDFDKKSIHQPYESNPAKAVQSGYPKPIIDLNEHRAEVMKAFKAL